MPVPRDFFAGIPGQLPSELIETLVESGSVRVERIVSRGQASPEGFWYDQPRPEWVMLLRGAARLQFADQIVPMRPGDWINIPAHSRHRVEWTTPEEPTVWLAIYYSG
jgi:cupin 2 domain-containing protein